MLPRVRHHAGFTLPEIVAAIAVPAYLKPRLRFKDAVAQTALQHAYMAAKSHWAVNDGSLRIATGEPVALIIDSPARAGSGCLAGSGSLNVTNNAAVNNAGEARNLLIFVVGDAAGHTIDVNNAIDSHFALYAQRSDVIFRNTAKLVGAVSAKSVEFKNSVDFTWDPALAGVTAAIG